MTYIILGFICLINLYIWAYRISRRRKLDREFVHQLLERHDSVERHVVALIETQQLLIQNLSNVKDDVRCAENDIGSVKDKLNKLATPRIQRPGYIGQDSVPFNYGR